MASDKQINIGVGADISGLKTGMDSAAKTVQDAGKKMESAAKEATAKTESSFSNLRQAYRATAKDAYEIALSQGTQSAAFLEAAKRAGEFKDELDLVNTKIAAFSSDTPVLTSALGVGQGLAGAFATAQGAMALFGGQSKEVEQALLKVQGAMALLQGLQSIGQLTDAMSAFSAVIKVQVLPALMTMQGAIIATGIGAVVVAVIALTQAASAYNDQIDREIDLKKQRAEQDKLWNAAVNKAAQAELKTEELRVRAMQDGLAKQLAQIELKKKTEILAEKDILANSYKTYTDTKRFEDRLALIKTYYEKEREIAIAESKKTKDATTKKTDTKVKFSDLKNQIKFVPTIDTSAIEDLTGLMDDAGSQLAESLDGAFSPIDFTIADMQQKLSDFATEVEKTLIQGAANAFAQFGQMAGANMEGANQNIGAAAEAMIGSLAATIGSGMIALGIPMLGAIATAGEGAALIAGGTALNILAGSLNAKSQKKVNSTSGSNGNYSPNNSFSGFTPQNNSLVLSTRLIGNDLLMSVQKSGQQMGRVR